MLESLPEIDDQFFTLPRVNSLKTFTQDEKLKCQNLGTGNFVDWANGTVLNSVSEFLSGNQAQPQGMVNYGGFNDLFVSSIPMEEEVQSGVRAQRVENSGFYQQNANVLTQGLSNSLDPYGFRYPSQPVGYGFRQ